ncbi:hypothetical protein AZI87_14650 [Bdellovibrio bacteriovorus]|uniref:EGF-like domain-containing protein n=1 Tax=Bdellovibrio bacteriovorus TaxID=959 RepID=A0A162FVD2_BDEBC|nr:hypothetical protein [Bdellovibrio bacteriovorus]KYG62541.1 hypothetical protein AZI87_14650 [Bdellovibrio bacteriovorus]
MKMLLISSLLFVSAIASAQERSLFSLPVTTQPVVMSSEGSNTEADIQSTSRYCCIRRGGTYCDMGYYDRFGQPCSCFLGNNEYEGHVCR